MTISPIEINQRISKSIDKNQTELLGNLQIYLISTSGNDNQDETSKTKNSNVFFFIFSPSMVYLILDEF